MGRHYPNGLDFGLNWNPMRNEGASTTRINGPFNPLVTWLDGNTSQSLLLAIYLF
jgi:hypothetical protein